MSNLPDGIEVQHHHWGEPKEDVMPVVASGDVSPVVDGWKPPVKRVPVKRKAKGTDEPR